jgi:hypothetical protein
MAFTSVQAAARYNSRESPMHVDLLNRLYEPTRADSDGQVAFDAPYAVLTARRTE